MITGTITDENLEKVINYWQYIDDLIEDLHTVLNKIITYKNIRKQDIIIYKGIKKTNDELRDKIINFVENSEKYILIPIHD